jgi:hypothetical protein
MTFAMSVKKIECKNCGYTGRTQIKGSDFGMWLLWLFTVVVSFFFISVFIVAGMMLFYLVCKPDEQICPECKNPHPMG